jgi:hypothetical protein
VLGHRVHQGRDHQHPRENVVDQYYLQRNVCHSQFLIVDPMEMVLAILATVVIVVSVRI